VGRSEACARGRGEACMTAITVSDADVGPTVAAGDGTLSRLSLVTQAKAIDARYRLTNV
jgi:hypothetical protein